jgi:hypothetical protein
VHRNKTVFDNQRDEFCLPNSELMYYEKIVHVESVKKSLETGQDLHVPSIVSQEKDSSSEFINNEFQYL